MKVALYGLNIMALAASVVPAVLIFDVTAATRPMTGVARETFFVLLGAGALMCVIAGVALTKHRRPDPALATRLLSFGGLLFTGAIGWAMALFVAA